MLHRTVSPNRMCKSLFFSLKVTGRGPSLSLPSLFLSLCASLSDTSTLHLSVSLSLTVSLSVPLYLSDISTLHLSIPFCLIEFSVSHPSEVEHCSPPWVLSDCETGQSGRTGLSLSSHSAWFRYNSVLFFVSMILYDILCKLWMHVCLLFDLFWWLQNICI